MEEGAHRDDPRGDLVDGVAEVGDSLANLRAQVHGDESGRVAVAEVVLQVVDDAHRVRDRLAGVLQDGNFASGVQLQEPGLVLRPPGDVHDVALEGQVLLVQRHHDLHAKSC